MVKVGDVVTYVNEKGLPMNALVQCVHNPDYINVVVVSDDGAKEDGDETA